MIPVDQTIFGDGSDGTEAGNCFAACIASLLELPLSAVPNFCGDGRFGDATDQRWWFRTQDWLNARGFWMLEVSPPEATPELPDWPSTFSGFMGYHVMSGKGPRGFDHCVVGFRGTIVHDPHPSRAGLCEGAELVYSVLVPVDPAPFDPANAPVLRARDSAVERGGRW